MSFVWGHFRFTLYNTLYTPFSFIHRELQKTNLTPFISVPFLKKEAKRKSKDQHQIMCIVVVRRYLPFALSFCMCTHHWRKTLNDYKRKKSTKLFFLFRVGIIRCSLCVLYLHIHFEEGVHKRTRRFCVVVAISSDMSCNAIIKNTYTHTWMPCLTKSPSSYASYANENMPSKL